jgi:hypothetical protein
VIEQTDADRWAAELMDAARAFRRIRRAWYGGKEPKVLPVPDLEDLDMDLPRWLGDEVLFVRPPNAEIAMWYDPEGAPIAGDYLQQAEHYGSYRADPRNRFQSRPFYRSGMKIWVSTVYLGLDRSFGRGGPPVIWETMIFAGDYGGVNTWCYATRPAAQHGHRRVVAAVAEAQRLRRLVVPYVPPRRRSAAERRPAARVRLA